jgi:uncharacterized membrane protein YphA (DoxX/SURF4 family)
MPSHCNTLWADRAKKAILLIRVLVGWVFLSEGIQKSLFPEALGVDRFIRIGIRLPQSMWNIGFPPERESHLTLLSTRTAHLSSHLRM